MTRCDCLNDCGDDPLLQGGGVTPCEHRKKRLQGTEFVSLARSTTNPSEVVVTLSKAPTERNMQELSRRLQNLRGI
ncbi:hypothetical protein [Ideonella paludis]|uniref:Uncharacterized protein n=1 Tax=Ideonella paludis TaxID=1233411 RepID=A0ABS5DU42_9BURK|nr:hypothetical protein [Ideonella paludis]MBQ0934619.1 hypothetical protein [Ideonella paludis]